MLRQNAEYVAHETIWNEASVIESIGRISQKTLNIHLRESWLNQFWEVYNVKNPSQTNDIYFVIQTVI